MVLRKHMLAVLAASWLALAGSASADEPPPLDLVTTNAAGLPGAIVYPTFSLDISGFSFDSLTLKLVYPTSLTLLPGTSTVSFAATPTPFNGPLNTLPGYAAGRFEQAGFWQDDIASFSLVGLSVAGPLLLTGAFQIDPAASPGSYQIAVSGLVSTGPLIEEPEFTGMATVTVVPEPETWLLWICGIGLLLTRAARQRPANTFLRFGPDPGLGLRTGALHN